MFSTPTENGVPLRLRRLSSSPLPLSLSRHFIDFFSPQYGEKRRESVGRGEEKKKKKIKKEKKNVIFFAGPCQLSLILYSPSHGRYTEVESQGLGGENKEASVSSLYSGGWGVGGEGGIQTFSCSAELKTCPAGLF